jgi:hypothetical protein
MKKKFAIENSFSKKKLPLRGAANTYKSQMEISVSDFYQNKTIYGKIF